jgi:hypothetical protein
MLSGIRSSVVQMTPLGGGREGKREGGRERGREGGRKGEREGGQEGDEPWLPILDVHKLLRGR